MLLDFLRFALIGASTGAVIGLLGLGVNVIYRTTKVVNFSHAAIALLAAYSYAELVQFVVWWTAGLVAILVGMVIGLIMEIFILRPLQSASFLTKAISTIGVLLVLQALLTLRYGNNPVIVSPWLPDGVWHLGAIPIGADRVLAFLIALFIAAGVYFLFKKSGLGIATSALSVSEQSLAALGKWSPRTVSMLNWLIAGGLAGIGGVLLAPMTSLTPVLALGLIIPVLSAALVGNLSSFWLTFFGGVGVGVIQAELSVFTDLPGLQETVPFLIIVIVLSLRGKSLPQRGEDAERLPLIGTGRIPVLPVASVSIVLAVLILFVLPEKWAAAIAVGLIAAIILLSLVVVTGYAGQLSLGSYALAGCAALISAQLVANAGWSFLPAAIVGVLITAPVGILFGLPAVRTRGTSLAIVTLGLAVSVQTLILNNSYFSNGITGLEVGQAELFGVNVSAVTEPRRYALLVLVVFVGLAITVLNMRRSAAGRRMIAVRGNERAAASLGISVPRTKLYAFVVSALLAGAGGVLLAFTNPVVSLANPGGQFDPINSLNAIAQITIGGIGFVGGTVVGTMTVPGSVVATLLQFITSGAWFNLIGGLLMLITVIMAPSGVAAQLVRPLGNMLRKLRMIVPPVSHDPAGIHQVAIEPVPTALLEVRGLSISFGGNKVLDNIDVDVVSGQVLGVIGPNGAGKSTLVDAITGFNKPMVTLSLDGEEISGFSPSKRARAGISRSFQSLELFEDLSVYDNLLVSSDADNSWYEPFLAGVLPGKRQLSEAAKAAVKTLRLDERLDDTPSDLSYGERRLLAIARSLASRPRILLLDEPAAGLGAEERQELSKLIVDIAKEWNIGVLLIEHDVDLVLSVSDTVMALDFGRKIAQGKPSEIRGDAAVVAAYLGTADSEGLEPEESKTRKDHDKSEVIS